MLPFLRPDAHKDFTTEAQKRLDVVRSAVVGRNGQPHSDDFDKRDLWSGSWKGDGRHKKTLAGVGELAAKCAWCERILEVARELDVEHYRPKVKVTRWEGSPNPVSNVPPRQIDIGPGYWWLAFSWKNYALSCKACNEGWKRNLFPVRDPRPSCVEGVEAAEKPLLLDPSTPFEIREHFAWAADAIMRGVSEEGRATIITCGLNRSPLVAQRVKLLKVVLAVFRDIKSAAGRKDIRAIRLGVGELASLGDRRAEFAGMVRWFTEQRFGWSWGKTEGLPD